MGIVVSVRKISTLSSNGLLRPIVYCCGDLDNVEPVVSLNRILAEQLAVYKPKRRTMQIEKCLSQTLAEQPDGVFIKDFGVLFNPDYKIDILQVMINVCKNKPFNIIWPGRYENEKLFYAEEGYPDYKVFNINNYDVTCVI